MRALAAILLVLAPAGCSGEDRVPVPGRPGAVKTAAALRAERRSFDGAPSVIPHLPFGAACTSCHGEQGMAVAGVGFAPPTPHASVEPPGAMSRCVQCHVFRQTDAVFQGNAFEGLRQDLRAGQRLHGLAPPVIPHQVLLRENCLACHSGPAAREEIRCSHPERSRCVQCHVEQKATDLFAR
jgi:cytochrome c-type protein NapB